MRACPPKPWRRRDMRIKIIKYFIAFPMRKSILDERKKLIPLRRLAIPGLYDTSYLSQLVQRKKLKAEKIGRNYYTTKDWFMEYLERHAQDDKRIAYKAVYKEKEAEKKQKFVPKLEKKENKIINFIYKTIAISAVVFVFVNLIINYTNTRIVESDANKGQVAGVEEVSEDNIGTSTTEYK